MKPPMMKKRIGLVLALGALVVMGSAAWLMKKDLKLPSAPDKTGKTFSLKEKVDSLHAKIDDLVIHIDKSDYTLSVLYKDSVLKTYPVVFGGNPVDDKLREGDQCTPEGKFKMISKRVHPNWSRFIWFDYPNQSSWVKHKAAKASGKIPKSARIGGEVGIHGLPEGDDWAIDQKINWTLGCISLKNDDVIELYEFIGKNTVIEIVK